MSTPRFAVLLATLWLLVGCYEPKICNDFFCGDSATLSIQRDDGTRPSLHAVLVIDGTRIECPAPSDDSQGVTCGVGITMGFRQLQDCQTENLPGGVVKRTCVPNGRYEQVVAIPGTPSLLQVSLGKDGSIVAERTYQPQYKSLKPNCDVVCRQWSETISLP